MARVLVIGYGNPLRGDDGVGWHAAEALAKSLQDEERVPAERVMVLACHQLTLELAEPLSRVERVIFIDACDGPPPGSVDRQPIGSVLESQGAGGPLFSHHLDLRTL